MRRWADTTFVFVSANEHFEPGCVEARWLPVMRTLAEHGASVRLLALPSSPVSDAARGVPGVSVDPYILDKWNIVRSRSRLRKYLRRLEPVAVHSTGLEADLVTRWAARKVALVNVVHTVTACPGSTRRSGPIDALMRRFDEMGMRSAVAVFVDDAELAAEVASAGVADERIVIDSAADASERSSVERHLGLYRDLMAERGIAH
jgi:hypothetical protein